MRITIFHKLLLIYFAISIVSLIGLYAIIGIILENQLRTEKVNELKRQAHYISEQISTLKKEEMFANDIKITLKEELRTIERVHNIRSAFIYNPKNTKKLINIGLLENASASVRTIFDTKNELIFTGKLEANGQDLLTLGTPVIIDDQVILVFLLAMQITDVDQLQNTIQENIFISFFVIAFLISLVIYWTSKKLVTPIHQMSEAAEKMMHGQFHVKIPVSGNNELSHLAIVLNQMAEKLNSIEKKRTRYISEVAHEFRTPLTTIFGTLRAIQDRAFDETEQSEFIQNALVESKRLAKLIEQLLILAKFDESISLIPAQETSLNTVIDQSILLFDEHTHIRHITWKTEIPKPLSIIADSDQIKQVFINLFDNAITHNPIGIQISIHAIELENAIQITVSDTGTGIDAEHLPHLFERFYKADQNRSKNGSGLGLAIAKSIIEQHLGTIEVTSTSKGTTFFIHFPKMKRT